MRGLFNLKSMAKWGVTMAAVALMGVWASSPARAEDAPKTEGGTVSGVVTNADGTPAKEVTVRLYKAADMPVKGKPAGGKTEPIARATTDDAGKYTLANVPAGDYTLVVGERKTGSGRESVTVAAGASATGDVKLKEPQAGGGKKAAGGGAK